MTAQFINNLVFPVHYLKDGNSDFNDINALDLLGHALKPLSGRGTDYSLRFHLFDGRIESSVTYFETTQENLTATVDTTVRDELNRLLSQPFVNQIDYRDRTATGWEYQVVANLTRNWTLMANYSNNETTFTRFFPLLGALVTEAQKNAQTLGLNPDVATDLTQKYLEEQEGIISATNRANASLTTRYTDPQQFLSTVTVRF